MTDLSPSSDSSLRIDRETVRALVERLRDDAGSDADCCMQRWEAATALLAQQDALEASRLERKALLARVEAAEAEVLVAAGMLSTFPPYSSQHPEVALQAIKDAARGAER